MRRDPKELARSCLSESAEVAQALLRDLPPGVAELAEWVSSTLRAGGRVLAFGNGGSAADAQHFAAELVGFFEHERPAFAAVALTTDSSILTAVANDVGVEHMFTRQLQALGNRGDLAIGISTSGRSANVLNALSWAQSAKIRTAGLTGARETDFGTYCDLMLSVPSTRTARIQEGHGVILHAVCTVVEADFVES